MAISVCEFENFSKHWVAFSQILSVTLLIEQIYIEFTFRFSSVQFSRSVVSDSLWPHESQHARLLCPSPTPRVHSDSRPSSQWSHPAISSSVVPFSSCPKSLPAAGLFQWVNSSHEMAKVLELQHQSFQKTFKIDFLQDWMVWSSCCPRDSQESSPAPQFFKIYFFIEG